MVQGRSSGSRELAGQRRGRVYRQIRLASSAVVKRTCRRDLTSWLVRSPYSSATRRFAGHFSGTSHTPLLGEYASERTAVPEFRRAGH